MNKDKLTLAYHFAFRWPSARVGRMRYFKENILYVLLCLAGIGFYILMDTTGSIILATLGGIVAGLIVASTIWKGMVSLQIERLHDINLSGWWLFVVYGFGFIPMLWMGPEYFTDPERQTALWEIIWGFIPTLFLLLWPGRDVNNRFGERIEDR